MPSSVPATVPTGEEIGWAIMSHLVALVCSSFLLGIAMPLIALACNKDSAFVRSHAKASLNFQLSLLIWAIAGALLCFVLVGFFVLFFVAIFVIVLPILACINAASGNLYRYPFTIQFVK
jgi:hypothetical protein